MKKKIKIKSNLKYSINVEGRGSEDITFLSINPKHDMKLLCGFTQNST